MRSRFLQGAIMRFTLCLFALPMPLALLHAQDTMATGVFYNLINQNSGSCIDDTNSGTANGTKVQQWACGEGTYSTQLNQQWEFENGTASGYYYVANANAPTETWNVTGNGTTSGSLIQTWTYAGNSNEEWQAVSLGNGYYKFVGQGSGLCLDTPGASTANGVQLQIYTCNGTAAQAWKLVTPSAGNSEEPYSGTPVPIPGTVMAENYDTGGQGVGYSVASVNGTDNGYRSDGVDLETASTPATGNDLGWSASGQWFKYTVNISTAGTYTVSFLVAAESAVGDAFHLSNSSGTNLTGSVAVPDTGGWQTWTTATATVTLPAGEQTLTLNQDNAGWNIDSMAFASGSGGGAPPARLFAPFEYVGDLGDANQIPGIVSASGAKAVILAFLDPDNNGCNLIWPGANGPLPSDTVGSTSMATAIADLQAAGVTVGISQGGAGGQEAAAYCSTAAETQAVYQQLITQYHVKWLDFDVEYPETSGQPTRRAQALAALQAANPGLIISYTLPLGPGGLDSGTGGGTTDLTDAKSAGLNLTIVNGMAMDFGQTNENQPALSEEGAAALKSQIQSTGLTSTVGLTFLPGTSDDDPPQYFTLANATTMVDFAETNGYITLLSFWELNRDNGGCPGSTVDEDTCSGVSQSNYQFSSIFEPF
jgi:hypothetical protein